MRLARHNGNIRLFHSSGTLRDSSQLRQKCQEVISGIKEAGTYKKERIITSPQSAHINVTTSKASVLNFCANNYLGLADNSEIISEAKKYLDTHGMGLASVRFICGTTDAHKELERRMSEFHQTEDTILYGSCFDANAGIFEALLGPEDGVFSDELNHASIIDGIRLTKAQRYRYKHLDVSDLDNQLTEAHQKGVKVKMVVTDGVFSMDGDIAPLKEIADVCDKHKATLMIDECHATGVIGKTGRGTPEYHNVMKRVDIINSTFGKALGGATGGYTTGPKEIIDLLRNKSRPYLFSNSLAPPVIGCNLKALDILTKSSQLIDKLAQNTKRFRTRMTQAGFTIGGKDHAIAPVMLGDAKLAAEMADELLQLGIYVIGFSYPVVPIGKARIRVQLSAGHTLEDIDKCVDAFITIGKRKKVIA